jgi:hypothetical protein
METEGNTRFIKIKTSLKEKLDLFVRFMRSKWLAYLFIMAYITMLLTLLVMVLIIVRFAFISSKIQNLKMNLTFRKLIFHPTLLILILVYWAW